MGMLPTPSQIIGAGGAALPPLPTPMHFRCERVKPIPLVAHVRPRVRNTIRTNQHIQDTSLVFETRIPNVTVTMLQHLSRCTVAS